MKFMLILAAIPVLTLSGGWALKPSAPKRVEAEGIRAQRMDSNTFRYRYGPVADMPPTVETKLEPLLLVDAEERPAKSAKPAMRTVRTQTYSICTRHGMRKVMVGRYKWRCRR